MAVETCADCSTPYAVGLSVCPNCRSAERAPAASAAPPPIVGVSCTNADCAAVDVPRRVVLSRPVPGVVELPTLLCAVCGWVLPMSWPGPVESDGDQMSPKITRHGGASNKHDTADTAAAETEPAPETAADQAEPESPADALPEPDADAEAEGGEEPSPGSNSSTSTEKPSTTSAKSKPAPRKRTARASRSTPDQTESSSPDSPDTSGPVTESPTDDSGA